MKDLWWLVGTLLAERFGRWGWRGAAAVVPTAASIAIAIWLCAPVRPCVVRCEAAERIDRELDRTAPDLVVIGNSMARRDVDLPALARGLGVEPPHAALLTLPGSSPGAWYATLKYRVFDVGHRPRWVVVVGASRSFWITRPTAGADVDATIGIAGTDDPVISRVLGVGDDPLARWAFRADLRKRRWRATAVNGVASLARPLLDLAGVTVEEEVEQAVGGAAGSPRGLRSAFGGRAREGEIGMAASIGESFLPEIDRVVRTGGARLVFARVPPLKASNNAFLEARPEADEEMEAWARGRGVVYARLPDLALPRDAYADPFHLTEEGAAAYTAALVAALHAEGLPGR